MTQFLSRRAFALGSTALAAAALLPGRALAQGAMRTVTTPLGTYDIPAVPQRVATIDWRCDLQPAVALGLPVIGYAHSVPGDWVPLPKDAQFYGPTANIEMVLASAPDLIICADYDPDSEWWPINKLKTIAPVLPTNNDLPWKEPFRQLAAWLGMGGAGEGAMAEYDQLIAGIKAKHGGKLQDKKVIALSPADGALYPMNGTTTLHAQVLTDLGANFVAGAPGAKYDAPAISSENFLAELGDVDGFLIATTAPDSPEVARIEQDPIWQRLPAVTAGAIVASNGNVNYGSIYSAKHLATLYDALYSKIA